MSFVCSRPVFFSGPWSSVHYLVSKQARHHPTISLKITRVLYNLCDSKSPTSYDMLRHANDIKTGRCHDQILCHVSAWYRTRSDIYGVVLNMAETPQNMAVLCRVMVCGYWLPANTLPCVQEAST
jgi:hypothetical protein